MNFDEVSILEVTDAPLPLSLLREFYSTIYTAEFPDANERESLENMEEYLRLKTAGWYRSNNYHILLLQIEGCEIAGGVVADYFSRSNAGVIEFMVVDPKQQGRGLGKRLLSEITNRFTEDARRAGHEGLNGVCGEVNDPYRRCDVEEHLDGFARFRMWDRFGYRLLDFPYVQPALSGDQEAVKGLGLMFQPQKEAFRENIPASLAEQIVADYQIWAMRIPEPGRAAEFRKMQHYLSTRESVALLDMRSYICEEEHPPFLAIEIKGGDERRLTEFATLYQEAFRHEETAVDVAEFVKGTREEQKPVPHHYWLWGMAENAGARLSGLASCFSFPHCGFGGYVALSGALRGKGLFRRLLRIVERRMVEVNSVASGWYVECEQASGEASVFKHCGFTEVPMTYLQPKLPTDLTGVSDGKHLELLFKPFGRTYELPTLSVGELRRDLREIFSRIYYLGEAEVEVAFARMRWPAGSEQNVFEFAGRA